MNSKLLTLVTLFVTTVSFAQLNLDFEVAGPAYTPSSNNASGSPKIVNEGVANPHKTGINTSDMVGKITETVGAQNWDFATWNDPKFGLTPANGHFISFKYLSENETSLTINLITRHWDAGLGTNGFNDIQKTVTVTANTWNTIEFDLSGETYANNWTNMFAVQFNKASGLRDGDVFYVDDFVQSTSATLGTETKSLSSIKIYPNPTNDIINVSGLKSTKTITIHNVLGQEVKRFNAQKTIDISTLVKGVYFLKTDNGFSKKIIKN